MERERNPKIEIRQTTMEDILAFREVQGRAWIDTYPSPENGVSKEWVEEQVAARFSAEGLERSEKFIAAVLDDPSQIHRVAVQEGEVVGFAHGTTHEDGVKELLAIYVDPEAYGTGIGSRLMDEINQWAEGSSTRLTVASYNQRAIRFYEKQGFEIVPGSEAKYKDVIPVIDMIREAV